MRRLTVESAERTVISWVFARASGSAINATDTRSKPTEESAMTAETLATEGNFVLASRAVPSNTVTGADAVTMASARPARSEEHTSELQSLMRISYAVFCLKKKKDKIKES